MMSRTKTAAQPNAPCPPELRTILACAEKFRAAGSIRNPLRSTLDKLLGTGYLRKHQQEISSCLERLARGLQHPWADRVNIGQLTHMRTQAFANLLYEALASLYPELTK